MPTSCGVCKKLFPQSFKPGGKGSRNRSGSRKGGNDEKAPEEDAQKALANTLLTVDKDKFDAESLAAIKVLTQKLPAPTVPEKTPMEKTQAAEKKLAKEEKELATLQAKLVEIGEQFAKVEEQIEAKAAAIEQSKADVEVAKQAHVKQLAKECVNTTPFGPQIVVQQMEFAEQLESLPPAAREILQAQLDQMQQHFNHQVSTMAAHIQDLKAQFPNPDPLEAPVPEVFDETTGGLMEQDGGELPDLFTNENEWGGDEDAHEEDMERDGATDGTGSGGISGKRPTTKSAKDLKSRVHRCIAKSREAKAGSQSSSSGQGSAPPEASGAAASAV